MSRALGVIVILVSVLALIVGCGPAATPAATTGPKATATQQVGVSPTKTPTPVPAAKVPDDMKDFPVPSGFEAGPASSVTVVGGTLYKITYTGKSTPDKVFEFYRNALPALGWTEGATKTLGESGMVDYSKTNLRTVTISVTTKGGEDVEIHVTYTLYVVV